MAEQSKESVSQTAGPYVHIGCVPTFAGLKGMYGGTDLGANMVNEQTLGERITIVGLVIDGRGEAVKDALIEIWQADHAGIFNSPLEQRGASDPNFFGWGRQPTNRDSGQFKFETIRPGIVPYADGRLQAPCINFWIVARGINLGLHTRMYFPEEAEANATDPVLQMVQPESRVTSLIAQKNNFGYRFNIRLQGDQETVFFDI